MIFFHKTSKSKKKILFFLGGGGGGGGGGVVGRGSWIDRGTVPNQFAPSTAGGITMH